MSVSIKKTGVVAANGNIGANVFKGTLYQPDDIVSLSKSGFDEGFLRYYNTNSSHYTFDNGTLTVLLKSSGNLGIAFLRLATDIDLDVTSYYTISCEAKCSKASAHLDIGLSYYKSESSATWRGGTGAQNFTAVDTWQRFTRTFKPDADTYAICYCFTVIGTNGGTDTFSLRHCKMEKGSVATAWCPSSADDYYVGDTSGFNETIWNASISNGYINTTDFIEY